MRGMSAVDSIVDNTISLTFSTSPVIRGGVRNGQPRNHRRDERFSGRIRAFVAQIRPEIGCQAPARAIRSDTSRYLAD